MRVPRAGRWQVWAAGLVLSATVGTGSLIGGPPTTAGAATNAPGVTATSINVGAISTLTGPIASNFFAEVHGVQAYFDAINASGGINGRKLNLAWNYDDGGNPSQFNQLVHTLVDQDHAFAIVGVGTAFFTPGPLVQSGIPTFGWDVTGNWVGPKNLFASGGSYIYYPGGVPSVSYVVKQVHAKSVAVVAYGIAASAAGCQQEVNRLANNGIKVSYSDLNVAYPGSGISSDVQRMQQAGSDFVLSCMDVTGNIAMSRAIHQFGLANKITQLWLNGNDQATLNQYPQFMDGVYFLIQHVPLTAPLRNYPGLSFYLSAMRKYEPNFVSDETAIIGWQAAALFAAGVRAAGNNLTQQNLINQVNKITAFTANGLTVPVNWTIGHDPKPPAQFCAAFIQAEGKSFVIRYMRGHQVFLCFPPSLKPTVIPSPPGTPGT